MIVTLERYAYMPTVTLGRLSIGAFSCFTLERQWLANKPFESCFPEGFFQANRIHSRTYGETFRILVPGRTDLLFHPANWVDQLEGCVALGEWVDPINYSDRGAMVQNSRDTFSRFLDAVEGLISFRLHVKSFSPGF